MALVCVVFGLGVVVGLSALVPNVCAQTSAPRVYLIAHPVASTPALEVAGFEAALLSALAESSGFAFHEAERAARGDVAEARAAHARALAGLRRGRQAFLSLELEGAIEALRAAVGEWDRAWAVIDDPVPVADTLMYLGASYALSGDDAAADAVFARRQVQFRAVSPDPRVFNPQILARLEQVQSGGADASLRVEAGSAAKAMASLDGRALGELPLSASDLAPGEHWLRVSVPGRAPIVRRVVLTGQRVETLHLRELEAASELLQVLGQVGSTTGAQRAVQVLGVDYLGVVGVAAEHATLRVFARSRSGEVTAFERELSADERERAQTARAMVASFLDEVLRLERAATPPVSAVVDPGAQAPEDDALRRVDTPWHRRWWVWTLTGAAVAAVGVTSALLLTTSDADPAPSPAPDRGTLVLEF